MERELETRSPNSEPRPEEEKADLYWLLQNSRQRSVLNYLQNHGSTTISELAEHIALEESGEISEDNRKRVYVSLYRPHLPKLDDAGLIQWDNHSGEVTVGDREQFQDAVSILEKIDILGTYEDPVLDRLFEMFHSERRQLVIQFLDENQGSIDLGSLAEQIAAKENNKTVDEITSAERKRVYVGLYQTHLPKMDDLGVVKWDSKNGQITLLERGELINLLVYGEFNSLTSKAKWHIHKLKKLYI